MVLKKIYSFLSWSHSMLIALTLSVMCVGGTAQSCVKDEEEEEIR